MCIPKLKYFRCMNFLGAQICSHPAIGESCCRRSRRTRRLSVCTLPLQAEVFHPRVTSSLCNSLSYFYLSISLSSSKRFSRSPSLQPFTLCLLMSKCTSRQYQAIAQDWHPHGFQRACGVKKFRDRGEW